MIGLGDAGFSFMKLIYDTTKSTKAPTGKSTAPPKPSTAQVDIDAAIKSIASPA